MEPTNNKGEPMHITDAVDFVSFIKTSCDVKESKATTVKLAVSSTTAIKEAESVSLDGMDPFVDNNAIILDAFNKLPETEKIKVIQSAFLVHRKEIISAEDSLRIDQSIELFRLKTFLIKAVLIFLFSFVALFIGVFLYISIKHGAITETGILTTLITSAIEVMKLIFIDPS